MRRFVFIATMVVALTTWLAGVVLADNGPHGGYTATTDACAGCHRAHTAQGAKLLNSTTATDDISGFCYTCHGNGGNGAYTDVRNGVFYLTATVPTALEDTDLSFVSLSGLDSLYGGGFEYVWMDPGTGGRQTLPTTSSHMVNGGSNKVWGFSSTGMISPTVDAGPAGIALTCTNCHNPHGKAGLDGTGNPMATYRILKGTNPTNTPLFANGVVTAWSNFNVREQSGGRWYRIDRWRDGDYFGLMGDYTIDFDSTYAALTIWCTQCHTRYMASANFASIPSPEPPVGQRHGAGSTPSGDAVFKFRHATNDTSDLSCTSCHLHVDSEPAYPSCVTCHVAHGTGARMGTYSNSVPFPDGTITTTANARSSLLRLDNRGVCQRCHNK